MPGVVDHDALVARHRQAGGPRPRAAGPVGDEHVQDLGGADAVQHFHTEAIAPALVQLLGQRLARRDAEPEGREVEPALRLLHLQHRRVQGRHAEEERRPVPGDQLEHGVGRRAVRMEHGLAAHVEREVTGVAEAVGEEQLRRREDAVLLGHLEHLPRVRVAAVHHVVLEVNGALGPARRPGRVEPERGVVLRRRGRRERGRRAPDPGVPREMRGRRPPDDHDVPQVRGVLQDRPRLRHERLGDDRDRRAAVVQEVEVVVGAQHGVDGDGDRPDLDRAEERPQEGRRVEQETEDALLRPHAQVEQRVAGAVHELGQARIAEGRLLVEEGGAAPAALGHVAVDVEGGRVELGGDRGELRRHDGSSLDRRSGRMGHRRLRPLRPRRAAPRAGARVLRAAGVARAARRGAAFTAMASTSTSSSGWTSLDTTSRVLGG